jgi:asparagine synthase (glutamine-hydrolysing)
MSTNSVTGDFILAIGPGARRWLAGLDGFGLDAGTPDSPVVLATRGPIQSGQCRDARRWLASADLVEGNLAQGAELAEGRFPHRAWRGRFVQLVWNGHGEVSAFTDHFDSLPLYWMQTPDLLALSSDLRLLLDAPGCERQADMVAVYHYLNFAYVPAPLTICRQIRRAEPGTRLSFRNGTVQAQRYYLPEYQEDLRGDDAALAGGLRARIMASVEEYRPAHESGWGCFLSGGTDSSSIVNILARQKSDQQVRTCSIGFAEAGYDELAYARVAARASGADAHFETVDRERALALVDTVLAAYDQPFGNCSAIPTLACAELGKGLGLDCLLAGDGGDEVFGGNQRYAKDRVMDAFYRLPAPVKAVARGVSGSLSGGTVHFLNRVHNFTQRASLPNPERFYTDDSMASDHYTTLLSDEFRGHVVRDASLEFMRGVYDQGSHASGLHRIMRLDLLMAIAQNDLVKVHRACKQHGISVRFPYLDPALVEYAGRLPARYKVNGLDKRHLFKRAMADILPPEILRKPKQGFGLPIADWMRTDPQMQALVREVLLGDRARMRGWIRPEFVEELLRLHIAGAWDHSDPLWQMMMLELWMRRYMDAH